MKYIVIGPEREYTEIVCEFGGPTYQFHDSYLVDAANAREAAWAAFRRAKKNNDAWYKDLEYYEKHPLSKVKVERLPREDWNVADKYWPKELRVNEAYDAWD